MELPNASARTFEQWSSRSRRPVLLDDEGCIMGMVIAHCSKLALWISTAISTFEQHFDTIYYALLTRTRGSYGIAIYFILMLLQTISSLCRLWNCGRCIQRITTLPCSFRFKSQRNWCPLDPASYTLKFIPALTVCYGHDSADV